MRIIQSPGIELHEIDRSQYDTTENNSIVGTTAFIMGFADKGDDYTTKYINTMKTFVNNYGYPTNEAERYFYNAAYEVINRGGYLLATKLPYDNESLKKYAFCSYTVDENLQYLSSPYDVMTSQSSSLSGASLYDFLLMPDIKYTLNEGILYTTDELIGIEDMDDTYLGTELNGREINVMNTFTSAHIYLPIITDLFEYILEQCNFKYSTQEVIKKYFYLADGETCRNDAVYMLKNLYATDLSAIADFCHAYQIYLSDDQTEISSMKLTLEELELGDFDELT